MNTIKQLQEIEKLVFAKDYDNLTPYLQGIRDMINLLNNREQAESELIETVKNNLNVKFC